MQLFYLQSMIKSADAPHVKAVIFSRFGSHELYDCIISKNIIEHFERCSRKAFCTCFESGSCTFSTVIGFPTNTVSCTLFGTGEYQRP